MTEIQGNPALSEQTRQQLAGFPEGAISAVLGWHSEKSAGYLRTAVLAVLEFYLPRHLRRSLAEEPDAALLREDLGLDSLALAEATFKLDELLGVPIETREAAGLKTVGELLAFLEAKLEFTA